MSQAIASSQPPPSAKPETAAMMSLPIARRRSHKSINEWVIIDVGVAEAISLDVGPGGKGRSLPVMTMQPMAGSPSKAASAAISSVISSRFRALSAFGRFSWTTPARPFDAGEDMCRRSSFPPMR